MVQLTQETKVSLMRAALGKLMCEYTTEGQLQKAGQVHAAAADLDKTPESLARLYDIITGMNG